jgi:hypothetical protein
MHSSCLYDGTNMFLLNYSDSTSELLGLDVHFGVGLDQGTASLLDAFFVSRWGALVCIALLRLRDQGGAGVAAVLQAITGEYSAIKQTCCNGFADCQWTRPGDNQLAASGVPVG